MPVASERERRLRLGGYYQNALYSWEQRYVRGASAAQEVLRELEFDWPQIRNVRDWCVDQAANDYGAAVLCSKFAGVAGTLLENQLSRLEQIDWMEAAVRGTDSALQSPDLPAELRTELLHDLVGHLTHLGFAHLMNQNFERARELCERALEVGREQGDKKGQATAQSHLAMIAMNDGDVEGSIELLRAGLQTFKAINDFGRQGTTFDTLGIALARAGHHSESLACYDQAVTILEQTGNASNLGTALVNRGLALLSLDRGDEAKRDLERAKEIAERFGAPGLRGLVLAGLADLHSRDADPTVRSSVIETLEHARASFEQVGDRIQEMRVLVALEASYQLVLDEKEYQLSNEQRSYALRRLAEVHRRKREPEAAVALYQRLLQIAKERENLPDQLESLAHLGHLSVQQNLYTEAVTYHLQALEVLSTQRRQEGVTINEKAECEIYLGLGQAYRHLSRPYEAASCYKTALTIAKSRHDEEAERRARGNLALTHVDLKKYDDAISEFEDLITSYQDIGEYRLLAHARFNLAYTFHQKGDHAAANHHARLAERLLQTISDPTIEEVRRQRDTWSQQLRQRHSELIDKRFMGSLNAEEEAELERIEKTLDDIEQDFYKPVIETLEKERDRLASIHTNKGNGQ